MTPANDKHDPEHLEREAHAWIARLVSGEATTSDAEALKLWRRHSPAHEEAFIAATRRWKGLGPAGHAILAKGQPPPWAPPKPAVSRRAMLGGISAMAAGIAGYAVVRPPLGLWPSLSEFNADYRTATGEQRVVVLADNVSIQLNTQTSLVVAPSTPEADVVSLISGEASFAVPKVARRPFAVLAGDGRSVVTRGRFDVRKVGTSVYVTCLDGEVQVAQGGSAATVRASQQLRYDPTGLHPPVAVNGEEAAAWQDGVLVFRFTPLSDVISEINRYRPGRVVLMNAELGANPVNGRFRIQRIDEVLTWIEQAFGAKTRTLPGGIVLLS